MPTRFNFFKLAVTVPLFALTGCFEVENGPAFSGGDVVPGFEGMFELVGQIDPTSNPAMREPDDDDPAEPLQIRRALNGSYVITNESEPDEYFFVTALSLQENDYVFEYSTAPHENALGVLRVDNSGDAARYFVCIDLEWEDDALAERAAAHGIEINFSFFGNARLRTDDPARLYDFMADLWNGSDLYEWHCSILAQVRSNDTASSP